MDFSELMSSLKCFRVTYIFLFVVLLSAHSPLGSSQYPQKHIFSTHETLDDVVAQAIDVCDRVKLVWAVQDDLAWLEATVKGSFAQNVLVVLHNL